MSWLDRFFRSGIGNLLDSGGTRLPTSDTLQFTGDGVVVTHDPTTGVNTATITAGTPFGALRTALRAKIGTVDGQIEFLKGVTTAGDGGGGYFRWSTGTATDDDGTILNENGFGNPATGYWQRIDTGQRHDARWFGATLDGATDDTTAIQRAIAVVAGASKILRIEGGTAKVSTLSIDAPTHIEIAKGGITATGAHMFALSANLRVDGHSPAETVLTAATGGTVIPFTDWTFVTTGDHAFEARNVRFSGGARHLDASTLTQFQGALWRCENCIFENATTEAVTIPDSVFYTFFGKCQFLANESHGSLGQATETIFEDCFFEMKNGGGGPGITLNGAHHVRFIRCDWFGYAGQEHEDVLIVPTNDGATGYLYFEGGRFTSEREYSLSNARRRVRVKNGTHPEYALRRLVFNEVEFLRQSGFALSSIGRTGGTATATVSTGFDSVGHQLRVGDVIYIINATEPTFNGKHTVTAKTTTTVSWADAGGTIAQAFGGGILGSLSTIAVALDNPVSQLHAEDCHFENYGTAFDDGAVETQDPHGTSGNRRWRNNTGFGPFGMPWQETTSGGLRGAAVFEAGLTSPLLDVDYRRMPREAVGGLRNRLQWSEDLTQWGATGITVTGSQTDPLGGATAFKLTRTGTSQIVHDNGTGWVVDEAITSQGGIDTTGLGTTSYLRIWGKAEDGVSGTLWIMVIDGGGRTHCAFNVTVGAAWKEYLLPLTKGPSVGGGILSLVVSAGGVYPEAAKVLVWRPGINDDASDTLPTTGAAYGSDTAGARFEKSVLLGSADVSFGSGTGSPEGAVTANVGSVWMRTDGGAGTSLYVKESGSGNTGWAAK